ncbi:MAG: glycosyltransferase family 39 protein [Motiliproteus sp.]
MNDQGRTWLYISLVVLTVSIATIFPRLMVIGGFPSTDEGFYAYQAQLIHSVLAVGQGLPDEGSIGLYPMLLSWLFELPGNSLILFRLADLIVAIIASCIFFRVLERVSGSRIGGALIALVFLFTMNQPIFIQTGFKNSIFAACIPLFVAFLLAQGVAGQKNKNWAGVGALVAISVLLRETFVPFLFLGALAAVVSAGWRACFRFVFGAALAGLGITFCIVAARGGVVELIDSYVEMGAIFASFEDRRIPHFIKFGALSADVSRITLILAGLSIIAIISSYLLRNRTVTLGQFCFWLACALLPLLEPASKFGYPYHFSVCLPGLAGLSALGWRSFVAGNARRIKNGIATIVLLIGSYMLLPQFTILMDSWPSAKIALLNASSPLWPAESVSKSNFLLAADAIRQAAPPHATLSISGFMFALYPLTGLLPPSGSLSNLSATVAVLEFDAVRFEQALKACPPDVLMTTTRPIPGSELIRQVVEDTGFYEKVATIPVSRDKSYGWAGGTVFKIIKPYQGGCDRGVL